MPAEGAIHVLQCNGCGLLYPPNTPEGEPCEGCVEGTLEVALCPCERHCRLCGCGDYHACAGGCCWVEDPLDPTDGALCSACLPRVLEASEQLLQDLALLEALDLIIAYHAEDGETRYQPTPNGQAVHHAA